MFVTRLLSGIVLLLAAVVLLVWGGIPLLLVFCLLSVIGQRELYRVLGMDQKTIAMVAYAMTVVYYALLYMDGTAVMHGFIVIALLVFMIAYVITFPKYKTQEITGAFFGLCYVSVLMSHVFLTRMLPDGVYSVWLILLSAWGSDTLAYVAGRLFGKHKMASKLSPKKTWEGAAGGILGAALLGYIFGLIFGKYMMDTPMPQLLCAVACAAGAIISMIGDLAASAIKRNYEIKDYGNLIPGHGGVLDRFDSMIFAAPAIYYAILLFQRFVK